MGLLLLKKGSIFTLLILAQKLLFAGDWEGTYAYQEKVESKVYQYEIIIYELESKTVDRELIPTTMSASIHLHIQNSTQALPASAKCIFSL